MDAAYGFCPYGRTCLLSHASKRAVEDEAKLLADFSRLDDELMANTLTCGVCGNDPQLQHLLPEDITACSMCRTCGSALHAPRCLLLVEHLLQAAEDDYIAYKDKVDAVRCMLPESLKVAFSLEAHRIASTHFGWSLASPQQIAAAIESVQGRQTFSKIVSVGAGTGYVEHLFGTVVGEQARVFAFDEILRPARFSVPVQRGGPDEVLKFHGRDTVLMLCWPPFGSPEVDNSVMGFQALLNFIQVGGQHVIYIGDVASTGDFRFHSLLRTHFAPLPHYRTRHEVRRWVPQEMGMVYAGNDTIGVYSRRSQPLAELPSRSA